MIHNGKRHSKGNPAHELLLVLARGTHEVNQLHAAQRKPVEGHHHDEDHAKAPEGEQERVGREEEREVLDRGLEHPRGHKEEHLREERPQSDAHPKRDRSHQQRLQRENRVHLPRAHAQHLIEAKLLLAPAHEEVVRVHHEKAQYHGEKDGDSVEDLPHLPERLTNIPTKEVPLHADGVERVEHGHAQDEREEVHGVVVQELAHVAKGELSEHRQPLPARPRPA